MINWLKQFARQIPGLRRAIVTIRRVREERRLKAMSVDEVFTRIFEGNSWGGRQSVSGRGSDTDQTAGLVQALPSLLREFQVKTLLDIPCGDFHWMKHVDLTGVSYLGADIVPQLIDINRRQFEDENHRFEMLDLIEGALPICDAIICRDCLVHLSFASALAALSNICRSGSQYLLTTHFVETRDNVNILTGQWRPLNLELPPFQLRPPLSIIREGCTEGDGRYQDKSLALWRIEDIAADLKVAREQIK